MSLQALASSEKSEYTIYTIFPLSVAFWIASQLTINDPLQVLATIASISSFGIILLYELTPDQWGVNQFLSWRSRSHSGLKEAVLILNALMRVWSSEPTNKGDMTEDYIEEQAKKHVSDMLSRPYVRMRTWRIRTTLYVAVSLGFILNAVWNYLEIINRIIDVYSIISPYAKWMIDVLRMYMFELYLIFVVSILVIMLFRHQKLPSNIQHLARFTYLQRLITIDKLRRPRIYSDVETQTTDKIGRPLLNLPSIAKEIELLNDLLLSNDWSEFIHRWDKVYHWIHREVVSHIEDYGSYDLMAPFSQVFGALHLISRSVRTQTSLAQTVKDEIRKLEWTHYFFNKFIDFRKEQQERKAKKTGNEVAHELPMPKFDQHISDLIKWSREVTPIKLKDPNMLLLKLSKGMPISRTGTGSGVLWAFAHLRAFPGISYLAGPHTGILMIIDDISTETWNLRTDLAITVFLRGYDDGGFGYSESLLEDYTVLKKIKNIVPRNMSDQYIKSITQFIRNAKKAENAKRILPLLQDSDYLEQILVYTPIRDAIQDALEKFKEDEDVKQAKQILIDRGCSIE